MDAGPSDEDLVHAARDGDRNAIEQILRRHHDRVLGVCRQVCRNPADAEDAAQEALIAIARGLQHFDGRSRLSTWVFRVTTNCCLDELRRRRRRPVPVDDPLGDDVTADGPGPEALAEQASTRAMLSAALDRLPEEFRVPLILRDVADLDYAGIAEVLDLSPGTVRSRISRARTRLAAIVDDADPTARGNRTAPRDVQPPSRPATDQHDTGQNDTGQNDTDEHSRLQ